MRQLVCLLFATLLLAVPAMAADFVWTTAEVKATRFGVADTREVGTIESGKRIEVLFKDGERIRVKLPASSQFGWIDAASVSDTAPEGASSDAPIGLDLPPIEFNLPGND
ncbi:MAG: hypothetical protein GY898_19885 [Proteobacteria bacterium]|nr:hypothetical protein [Pseudomonadota bacterium]